VDPTIQRFVLSAYPPGSEVLSARSYRPGYREYPARVSVRTPSGAASCCVVKRGRPADLLEREAGVLRALSATDLPVPRVIAGPLTVADTSDSAGLLLMSELPGEPLPWLGAPSLGEAALTCRLLIDAVGRLHALTDPMRRHLTDLPGVSLTAELESIVASGGPWLEVAHFSRAVDILRGALPVFAAPLVFSNGDYNPLNVLHDGGRFTGWVDFENACFEDPHVGFAKFLIWQLDDYGWGTGAKAGLVERYLYARDVSRREFGPRLALRCLRHLQQEVPPTGEEHARQREHVHGLLHQGLTAIG
jgi:aminoglycoside phosphotransferase